ncbi:MAG: hypothetical protein GTO45_10420 [Candidatus Aminicenantes bacterium]|nr:hypothetical protein [Candidatus Aminicenantes bacterium]NIM79221.1 hypothetical protein [Candidatus Aminicenantes bacterium]NIN18499.1 hypothetical protein [Candidatus Aminicenantes bacterium]NIN42395.1 hypothetical protein [Candidatus Aminicenantes bacterium]NIN85162.1 hypothetical protein [Candidatus Aminicenantes bacterium]
MRRRIFISILVVIALVTLGSFGQLYAEKSFLWKVESDKGSSYLLGSIHLLKKEHYPLRQVIEDAFADSDTMLVEANLSDPEAMKVGMQLLQKGMYQGEETLKGNISEKTYQLAREKLKEMGLDIEHYKKFKPWMAAMTILNIQLVKLGFNPNYGIDMYFMNKAAGEKEILELEGIEFQLKLFENFSKEESEKFFLSSVLEADQLGKEMDKMVNAWVKGEVETLERLLTENVDKYPELKDLYKKIADDRNVGMVDKIDNYLRQGKRCFVVVGAAHMVGKKGIVQLLKDKGYTVTQL